MWTAHFWPCWVVSNWSPNGNHCAINWDSCNLASTIIPPLCVSRFLISTVSLSWKFLNPTHFLAFAHQKNNLPVSHIVTQTNYELFYAWTNHRKTHPSHMPLNELLSEFRYVFGRKANLAISAFHGIYGSCCVKIRVDECAFTSGRAPNNYRAMPDQTSFPIELACTCPGLCFSGSD